MKQANGNGRRMARPADAISRSKLPPREREVADIVYNRGEASSTEVSDAIPDISNSSARMMLRRLVAKGVVAKRREGNRDFFSPALNEGRQREAVLQRIANEHFDGSLFSTALKVLEMMEAREPGSVGRIARRYRLPPGQTDQGLDLRAR